MLEFGKNLRKVRVQRGLTQTYMAKSIGLTLAAYRFYEVGEREPNLTNLKKIAQILSIPVDDLLGKNDENDEFENAKKIWESYNYTIKDDYPYGISIISNEEVEEILIENGKPVKKNIRPMVWLSDKDMFINATDDIEKMVDEKTERIREEIFSHIIGNSKSRRNFVIEEKGITNYYMK